MRLFVTDGTSQKVITRSKALGYGSFDWSAVEEGTVIDIVSDLSGDKGTLVAEPADVPEGVDAFSLPITILCKEFGLADKAKSYSQKLSIIYLDDGYMLVTLYEGAILINVDGKQMMPSIGVSPDTNFSFEDVLWVNADTMLGYSKYLARKEGFVYDFEFMYELQGYRPKGLSWFNYKHLDAEDKDLSLGNYGAFIQQQEAKERRKEAQSIMKLVAGSGATLHNNSDSSVEFDDDDEDYEDYEEDDDDDMFI